MTKTQSVEDELKKLSRRVEEVAKTTDLLYKDREMFEDILLRLSSLEHALHMNREHQNEVANDIKADVKRIDYSVQDRVLEMKDAMDDKTVIVKSTKETVFEKILKRIGK